MMRFCKNDVHIPDDVVRPGKAVSPRRVPDLDIDDKNAQHKIAVAAAMEIGAWRIQGSRLE